MHCGDQRHLELCLGYVPALAYGSCTVSDQDTTLRGGLIQYIQYMKSHCEDKTVIKSSYLHNGISYTGKTASLYWLWTHTWHPIPHGRAMACFAWVFRRNVSGSYQDTSASAVISNGHHMQLECLLNSLFMHTFKLCLTDLLWRNYR